MKIANLSVTKEELKKTIKEKAKVAGFWTFVVSLFFADLVASSLLYMVLIPVAAFVIILSIAVLSSVRQNGSKGTLQMPGSLKEFRIMMVNRITTRVAGFVAIAIILTYIAGRPITWVNFAAGLGFIALVALLVILHCNEDFFNDFKKKKGY